MVAAMATLNHNSPKHLKGAVLYLKVRARGGWRRAVSLGVVQWCGVGTKWMHMVCLAGA